MSVLMVRSKKDQAGNAADAEAAIRRVFSAIEQAQPAGVRYASSRLADGVGVSFVVLLKLEDGVDNPLMALPAVVEFREPQAVDGRAADRGADDRRRVVPVVLGV